MSLALAEKLQLRGFVSDFALFTDGSLGFGFSISPLDISCWKESMIDGLGETVRSLLNGLPSGLDAQFTMHIDSGNSDLIDRHGQLAKTENEVVKALTQSRVRRLQELDEDGLIPKHRYQLFVRRPFANLTRMRPRLLQKATPYLQITERHLEQETRATEHLRDDIERQLNTLGLTAERLSQRTIAQIVYRQWNPRRPIELGAYDPDDIRNSLLFTDAAITPVGFTLANTHYRVLSLKILPDQTVSGMARALEALPFRSSLFVSIHVPDQQRELENLKTQRRLAFAMARGRNEGASDIDSEAKFQDLEDLISQMIAQGERVFHLSLNVVLRGQNEEELTDRVSQALTQIRELGGAEAMEETLAAFDIFCELSIPHARSTERVKRTKTSNLVDFLPLYGPWKGHRRPRVLLRSREGDLVGLDPFSKDLQNYNQMITGSSGSGKSFLTNLCLLQMLKEDPSIFIVDIGGSYRKLCDNLSGQYLPFQLNSALALNPFDLPEGELVPSSHKIKFLLGLVEIVTKEDGNAHLGKLERAEIENAIQRVFEIHRSPTLSCLKDCLQEHSDPTIQKFGRILAPWCGNTPYGRIVDRPTNIELLRNTVCFDLKGLELNPDLQAVCLFLITDFVWREVQRDRGRLKFLVLDECWKLLESASGATFIGEVFRTFRKYYASAIAISQNVDDFARSAVAGAILPNTAIKWVLNQKGADVGRLKDVLQLNDNELQAISELHQERGLYSQAFLMVGDEHTVVAVEPTPIEYWIATTDPPDLNKIEASIKEDPSRSPIETLKRLAIDFPGGIAAGGNQ